MSTRSSFSIDDVRETFTTDMNHLIGNIELAAAEICQSPLLDQNAWPAIPPLFDALADSSHSIAGTSGLVAALSLHESARLLETLSEGGRALLRNAVENLTEARRVAALCADGAVNLRAMLALELDHRGNDARELARTFALSTHEPSVLIFSSGGDLEGDDLAPTGERAERGTTPPQAAEDFTFEEAAAPAFVPDSEGGGGPLEAGIDGELQSIFAEEAREGIVVLHAHLRTLATQSTPSSTSDGLATLGHLERVFHTLKGAAATVRHGEASNLAATLQRRTEELIETEGWSVSDVVRELTQSIRRLEALIDSTGAQRMTPPPSLSAPDSLGPARGDFLEEAAHLCAEARRLLTQLPAAAGREADVRAELARSIHRLKGSALVVMEREIAEHAERLQHLSARQSTFPIADILETLGRIEEIVSARKEAQLPPPRGRHSSAPVPGVPREAVVFVREPVTAPSNPEVWEVFTQECVELLDKLDHATLDLEASDRPKQLLEGLTGIFHTLKGATNAVGLGPVGQEIHRIEDFLEDLVKAPILPPMRGVVSLLLKVQTGIRANLRTVQQGYVETSPDRLEARIARIFAGGPPEGDSRDDSAASGSAVEPRSSREHASGGVDGAGDRKYVRVGTERLDALMNLAGELVVSRSRLMTRVQVLRKLQLGISDSRRRLLDTLDRFRDENEFSVVGRGAQTSVAPRDLRFAPGAVSPPETTTASLSAFGELELDRYDDVNILARSLAEITDDVNETHALLFGELASFADDSDAFGSIVSGIQGEVTRARMVPLEAVFSRLLLPIRDAAERQSKEVRVTTSGGQVSLDKSIADALFSPLLHLVRNAVFHGIETPSARVRSGKEPAGELRLIAREESGQIVVEVHDDGAGLDLAALRARGIAMGLVRPGTPSSDPAIRDLVFASRLSTAAGASAVAGRGVGGDVVRRAVQRLNGNIRVETEAGQRTSFIARLPLTLAITRSLIVRHEGRAYAIPLHFAERILDVDQSAFIESADARRIKVDDGYLTLRNLSTILELEGRGSGRGPVILLRVGDQRSAVQVDAVIGQEEIVVKSLGDMLTGHPLFAGVTIRGSGDLVLIFDVPALLGDRSVKDSGALEGPEPLEPARAGSGSLAKAAEPVTATLNTPAPETSRLARAKIEKSLDPEPVARLRVLFVDDSLSVRKVAEKTLEALGVEVHLAVDGLDALSKLREQTFDIVFTDLEMPRMHGYDLLRELRFIPAHADMPIIVVSSRSAQKHQDQARILGASGYITKPFTAQTLDTALARWGRGKHRQASGGEDKGR